MMKTSAAFAFLFIAAATASAQGIVIPHEPDLPPLAIERHAVRTEIDHQAAVTMVEQIFVNNTARKLEGRYLFPIPKGAALTGFSLTIDGKETSGEMIDKDRARLIYQDLVQRTQDAGLLEYLGADVFQASLVIEPQARQTVTIRFTAALAADGGMIRYVHPVRAGAHRGPAVLGESSIDVTIRGPRAIENLYSPSHAILVSRSNNREARVRWTEKAATLHRDFELYWSQGGKDVALDLVVHRPDPTEPGYFMMLISPGSRLQPGRVVERDVVFVVDTSGSMAGAKIEQARNALKHCVQNLNDGDRFDIVRFSSEIESWKGAFVPAKELREAAVPWIDKFKAAGGTNIAGALQAALAYRVEADRPCVIVIMTDGKPTVGETVVPQEIVRRAAAARAAGVRIFSFGVGYDVDTQLLDGISEVGRGASEYVRPEENIETKVGAFWNKAGRPVLTDLAVTLEGGGVQLSHVHPTPLPDLFAGTQLVLFGRYTGEGAAVVRLSGTVNGRKESFQADAKFAPAQAKFGFVEPLWARRRIGSLLEAIRLHGESKELVDEVVDLAKRYGVQTPYTSWLMTEDGTALGGRAGVQFSGKAEVKLAAIEAAKAPAAESPAEERLRREQNDQARSVSDGFAKKDGKDAVEAATFLRRLKEADKSDGGRLAGAVKVAGTRLVRFRSVWVDERFDAETELVAVKFGSVAYFKLIEKKPDLIQALKIGSDVVFVTAKGKALAVSGAGLEEITDEQIGDLFQPVAK